MLHIQLFTLLPFTITQKLFIQKPFVSWQLCLFSVTLYCLRFFLSFHLCKVCVLKVVCAFEDCIKEMRIMAGVRS